MSVDDKALVAEESLPDAEARGKIRGALETTLVVEAAAGTGKTTMLVARVIALLTEGKTTLRRIVAVTFTEKAAGEMKLRLRTEVERSRRAAPDDSLTRKRLDAALAELEEARIGTIHALAADLLRERPVEARVDPVFQVAAGPQAEAMLSRAFDRWYQGCIDAPPPGIRRFLCRKPGFGGGPARQRLASAAATLVHNRDFDAPWRRDPFEPKGEIDALVETVTKLGALSETSTTFHRDKLRMGIDGLWRWVQELERREASESRDYDGLEAELCGLASRRDLWYGAGKRPAQFGPGIDRENVLARRNHLKEELDGFDRRSQADLASLLRQEILPFVDDYERLKTRTGILDFHDLLLKTRDLLARDQRVRNELQQRFDYLLVDEFQDTDPLQAEILVLLAASEPDEDRWLQARVVPGKLFVVGDPKQSIYRFRRADVGLYQRIKERLQKQGAEVVYLTTSFRAVAGIQALINAAFERAMSREDHPGQADYVALHGVRPDPTDRPSVVALPVPFPYGMRRVAKASIQKSYPVAVAAFVDWLLKHSGWTVSDDGEQVPVMPRHVCLIFRNMSRFNDDVTLAYTRALEQRQIPHVRVGGRAFHQLEEVAALTTVLMAVEWPNDELSVYATLRGPYIALSDEELLLFKAEFGRLSPIGTYDSERLTDATQPVAEALQLIALLHFNRNRRPIAETLTRFLAATRAHAGLAFWKAGDQRLANVLRLCDLARKHESEGATSFREFVDGLLDAAERKADLDAPMVEDSTDGVRLLTAHRSKGLEFPIVILCDPTSEVRRSSPGHYAVVEERLWVTKFAGCTPVELWEQREEALRLDEEEGVRLTYVAATRARDLLVVPVVGDERRSSWLDPLTPSIYPPRETKRRPKPPVGCPEFGGDSAVGRPYDADEMRYECVVPGRHSPEVGEGFEVTWWDPNVLDLKRNINPTTQRNHLLMPDNEGSPRSLADHDRWAMTRRKVVTDGRRKTEVVRSITEISRAKVRRFNRAPVDVVPVKGREPQRPEGLRFGSLVHAILEHIPLNLPNLSAVEVSRVRLAIAKQLAATHGRLLGATPQEVDSAAIAAAGALDSPTMQRAALSLDCRREVPVSMVLADGGLAEGIIDMAFLEPPPPEAPQQRLWTVVDFKTDQTMDAHGEAYFEQVRHYMDAIERATGDEAQGILLLV